MGDLVNSVLSLINPFSDNFFLKIAFIPQSNFFMNSYNAMGDSINAKFPAFSQLTDAFHAFKDNVVINDEFTGLTMTVKGQEVYIVEPTYINKYSDKIKFWFSGLIYFLVGIFLMKKGSTILNS